MRNKLKTMRSLKKEDIEKLGNVLMESYINYEFSKFEFTKTYINGNFTLCDFRDTAFLEVCFFQSTFKDCDFSFAYWNDCYFYECEFINCKFDRGVFRKSTDDLSACKIVDSSFNAVEGLPLDSNGQPMLGTSTAATWIEADDDYNDYDYHYACAVTNRNNNTYSTSAVLFCKSLKVCHELIEY